MAQLQMGQLVRELQEQTVIGRGKDSDFQIRDEQVSRRHCQIEYVGEKWWIEDFGVANRTIRNGKVMLQRSQLQHQDHLLIGQTEVVFLNPKEEHQQSSDQRVEDEPQTNFTDMTMHPMGMPEQPPIGDMTMHPMVLPSAGSTEPKRSPIPAVSEAVPLDRPVEPSHLPPHLAHQLRALPKSRTRKTPIWMVLVLIILAFAIATVAVWLHFNLGNS